MSHLGNRAFGLPSVPRESMPSMFQILGWSSNFQVKKEQGQKVQCQQQNEIEACVNEQPQKQQEKIVQNVSLTKSMYGQGSPKKRNVKSMTKSGIYEYKEVHLKRSASVKCSQTVGSKVTQIKKVEPVKKKLDPQNEEDHKEIQKRKQRIKKFEYVTRDLSNSAFNTYFGKPVFEAYGRSNSNPRLLSHNVMPHRGSNNPRDVQSYYSALIKGKGKNLSNFVPRNPIEDIVTSVKQEEIEPINLPLNNPDLINCQRFTAQQTHKNKNEKIPSHKIAAPVSKVKKAKKSTRKHKKRKPNSQMGDNADGLKYMNTRQDLLQILQKKKTNASKLAWKVTQCYPYDLTNEQKMKQSTKQWQNTHAAGISSLKCDSVKELMTITKKA